MRVRGCEGDAPLREREHPFGVRFGERHVLRHAPRDLAEVRDASDRVLPLHRAQRRGEVTESTGRPRDE